MTSTANSVAACDPARIEDMGTHGSGRRCPKCQGRNTYHIYMRFSADKAQDWWFCDYCRMSFDHGAGREL